jgi:hypothetical protein
MTSDVYVIVVRAGKDKGKIRAVVEAPAVPAMRPADEAGEVLRKWVHSAGLPESAVGAYRAEFSPVTAWRSVERAGEPLDPAGSGHTVPEVKGLVDELRGLTDPAALRTDAEDAAARVRVREICRTLKAEFPDDVFVRYGKYATRA